jgi:hypothetical protein
MKQRLSIYSLVLFFMVFNYQANSEPVDYYAALTVARNKMNIPEMVKDQENHFTGNDSRILFYLFDLDPVGYIAVTADNDLPPVITYSYNSSAGDLNDENNVLIQLLTADIQNRFENISLMTYNAIQENRNSWNELLQAGLGSNPSKKFQQWPPEGTTSTGGWLETNWTQSPPYNNFCPMDPVTNQRSVAGCPATAMAQIVNYYEVLNGTFFTDEDDYHHAYAGRNYWIDDDHDSLDFLSFPDMNAHLDTLAQCYSENGTIKNSGKAALTFACGVAAHQVYTSQVSGTFGVNQALMAYQRFGFTDVSFFDQYDTTVFATLAQNMMDARPAHLAVVDPGWTMGHNVVVDGYNTDEYYHLNFGWGGSYNGWYLLPEEIPYGLTVIEGVVADIAYPPVNTGIHYSGSELMDFTFNIYPNPVTELINVSFTADHSAKIKIDLVDAKGMLLLSVPEKTFEAGFHTETMNLKDQGLVELAEGLYLCRLCVNNKELTKRFIIR